MIQVKKGFVFLSLILGLVTMSASQAADDPTQTDGFMAYDSLIKAMKAGDRINFGANTRTIYRIRISAENITQPDVGMIEVKHREANIEDKNAKKLQTYIFDSDGGKGKLARVVLGPKVSIVLATLQKKYPSPDAGQKKQIAALEKSLKEDGDLPTIWLIDGHHLSTVFSELGYKFILGKVAYNYSNLSFDEFEQNMIQNKLAWLQYYKSGAAQPTKIGLIDLAGKSPADLGDDPFRSLAWAVKAAGGIKESDAPFQQFYWSDFFRKLFTEAQLKKDWEGCVKKATDLAHSDAAKDLIGYIPAAAAKCDKAITSSPDPKKK
jgi:hypothetical protein